MLKKLMTAFGRFFFASNSCKGTTVVMHINTPDANGFRKIQEQIRLDILKGRP